VWKNIVQNHISKNFIMKKALLLSAVSVILFVYAKAQAFAGLNFGYGIPATGQVVGINSEDNNPSNTFSFENVRGSFGSGLNAGVYFGYWFSDVVGAQLGVNYLFGKKYTFTDNSVNNTNVTDNSTDEVAARSLRLTPALRVGFGHGDVHPYMLGGFSIGLANKITDDLNETTINPGGTDILIESTEYTGGISVGPFAAVGLNFHLSEKLLFTVELNSYFANWAPTKGEIVTATFNGADALGNMTTDQKQFEYVNKIDQTMNTSASQPTQRLKNYYPMNSVGLTIGLHYEFSGTMAAQ
jgi:hypothetical protein